MTEILDRMLALARRAFYERERPSTKRDCARRCRKGSTRSILKRRRAM